MSTDVQFNRSPVSKLLKMGVAVPLAFLVADIFGGGGLGELLLWAVLTAVFYAAAHLHITRYVTALTRRIANSSGERRVSAGGTEVGVIGDKLYAQMKLDALRDPRILGQQIINIGGGAYRVVAQQAVLVPILLFWGLIAIALVDPGSIPALAKEMVASGAENRFTVVPLLTALSAISIWLTVISVAFGARYGLKNCYALSVQRSVCQHLGVPHSDDVAVVFRRLPVGDDAALAAAQR